MTTTLAELRTDTLYHLGDAAGALWEGIEVDQYLQEGYDNLCQTTRCLWEMDCLPDVDYAFCYTSAFEKPYLMDLGSVAVNRCAQYTALFERDYSDNAEGPANHTQHWEYLDGYVEEVAAAVTVAAVDELPENLYRIERATWNTRRIDALVPRDLQWADARYELNTGEVLGYLREQDGLNNLRKWRVPATPYVCYSFDYETDITAFTYTQSWESSYFPTGFVQSGPMQFTFGGDIAFVAASYLGIGTHNHLWERSYVWWFSDPHSDGFGIVRDLTGISSDVPVGDYGDACCLSGEEQLGESWGILGAFYVEQNNVRIQFSRRGEPLSPSTDLMVSDRYAKYVRYYAMARLLEMDGDGQDLKLSEHYQARYDMGIARILRRQSEMQNQRKPVLGGTAARRTRLPLARLPWQYPATTR